VRFSVRCSGDHAILEVEDTGPGIPVELRETIFERFWQAEGDSRQRFSRGTGLGLSIVKEFVSLHRVSGDGGTSESIDDTLKTTAAASLRTSVRGKAATETPRAEGPGNRVHDG
jgi:signal transduction histidine kinase